MFLTVRIIRKRHLLCLVVSSVFLLLSAIAKAAEPPPPCILDVPVYDPFGTRLPFTVRSVTVEGSGGKIDLLNKGIDGLKVTSTADQIVFSSNRIVGARPIDVTLDGPHGAHLTSRIIVTECRLRRSLFFGQSDLGHDVRSIDLRGRLRGCQFRGDWWVRAMVMFGGHEGAALEDGYVEENGRFWLSVGAVGVRRLLVIGKGNQPVKVIGVDVTVGKPQHDVGVVDLGGACPP